MLLCFVAMSSAVKLKPARLARGGRCGRRYHGFRLLSPPLDSRRGVGVTAQPAPRYGSAPPATKVETLWASSDAGNAPLPTVIAPSSLSFLRSVNQVCPSRGLL